MPLKWFEYLFLIALAGANTAFGEGRVRMLVQSSPLAGSQFHELKALRPQMRAGDTLTLTREADNPYDPKAVRVDWRGHKLGYVPRRENSAVAAALDRQEILIARISRLKEDKNPWKRVEFEIWVEFREEGGSQEEKGR